MSPKKRPRKNDRAHSTRRRAKAERPGAVGRFNRERMPSYKVSPLLEALHLVPGPLVPIYAVPAAWHQRASRSQLGTCVIVCHQIAGALGHLGIAAHPVAATATVYQRVANGPLQGWKATDTGSGDQAPVVTDQGTTDGHMVIHVPEPGLVIDATIVQNLTILEAAYHNVGYSVPTVELIPPGPAPVEPVEFVYDESLRVTWHLQAQWTGTMNRLLDDEELKRLAQHGATSLARDALNEMNGLLQDEPRLDVLGHHRQVDALLLGNTALPACD
ncbi:hypothetical protein [Kineosporia babensis]|uniref:Uncharacterized protein n=1 Tax=Kineosporia babensis TaxID=499548 RepID=A0A9X1NJD1_9ACTN|nr:hypothetical protein [Kineosporia babensis]MCD5316147.1 hypothetical protein [Kineosporia babensis]